MDPAERTYNPRVVAGTLAGFEGFSRFRSALFDPLRSLLPVAVEVEAVPAEFSSLYADSFRARGFVLDERPQERGRMVLAGPFDQFSLLAGVEEESPAGFKELAHAVAHAVACRFIEEFEVPARRRMLRLGRRPLIMGVLNVTPDSFSDGGWFAQPDEAIARAFQMVEEGADIVDVGAESTRPGAAAVEAEEEIRRLLPVIKALAEQLPAPLSLDTRKSRVAERFLDMGVDLINDTSGLEFDARMAEVAARRGCVLVINHMRGTPRTMQQAPRYDDVSAEVCRSLRERLERALRAGVLEERVILDPGIGFGKRVEDNLDLLARLEEIRSLGRPILIGCSRKSFLGELTGRASGERRAATTATTALAALRGVKMVRVHDVRDAVDALKVLDAIDERHRVA